ncbi:MAG: hypothetical protein HXX17_13525 [Geobacteraceae bacterium]|nr:hypothetical protein [Geobacteraceae bacterium]
MLKKIGLLMMGLILFAGCGSNSHNSSATLKISLPTATPARNIAGTTVIIALPPGGTPELKADGSVADGVVTASGTFAGATVLPPVYTAASGVIPGTLSITLGILNPSGVAQGGECATVALKFSGITPTAGSFILSGVVVVVPGGEKLSVDPFVSDFKLN